MPVASMDPQAKRRALRMLSNGMSMPKMGQIRVCVPEDMPRLLMGSGVSPDYDSIDVTEYTKAGGR